jgi:hypothetical protein
MAKSMFSKRDKVIIMCVLLVLSFIGWVFVFRSGLSLRRKPVSIVVPDAGKDYKMKYSSAFPESDRPTKGFRTNALAPPSDWVALRPPKALEI